MFRKILVANRGEIACRILRTLRRMEIASVAVCSSADRHAPHALLADEVVLLGPPPAAQSYLDQARIIAAARDTGAQAIHPGYGFLSENADFAEACAAAGIVFIGPSPAQLRLFGLKHTARETASACGVALAPGSGLVDSAEAAASAAAAIGYPVMLKGTAGGGGIGLQLCRGEHDMAAAFERTQRLAARSFGNAGVFVEAYVERGRHIEVQIFGDGKGRVLALGERDCSPQRRHQKVLEETPPAGIAPAILEAMRASAIRLGEAVQYASAGTVEFLYDTDREAAYFLEVNTRLQVEHCVTEAVTGLDLVEWMVRQAACDPSWQALFAAPPPIPKGAAIEARLYAEDPARNFQPSSGLLTHVRFPPAVRVDGWVADGTEITPFYDPLLAKLIVHAPDRAAAVTALQEALDATELAGIETNLLYLRSVARHPDFVAGGMTTRALDQLAFQPATIEVIEGGTATTVQDAPGRLGYWAVGIPPSGPMDALAFTTGNAALGNPPDAAGLEITLSGPVLRFHAASEICLTGAPMQATLDGAAVPWHAVIPVPAGATLRIGALEGAGSRAYLAVRGGIDVPKYLGSRATFTLGKFGGHGGRALQTGDILHLGAGPEAPRQPLPPAPIMARHWDIEVLEGPHAAPDYFTPKGLADFYAAHWEVHYNSNRTGVRLIGPKPEWARADGGEAGLHPSNIHDNAYAVGTIDFTGDMPIILGPDGPSLGGFVCPCTITSADLWKIGQLRAHDTVRFHKSSVPHSAILHATPARADGPAVTYRRAGDANLLVEFGPAVLDLELRLRAHALMQWLEQAHLPDVIDITPGIRSLQIHVDLALLPLERLLERLIEAETSLLPLADMEVPSRIIHLPLAWNEAGTRAAIAKYAQSVRADAPWCPSNIEFIRRINGLADTEEVKSIVYGASYLVLGLGDVYLGAPVATPVDPRHRLVTTKYNPARTWTPENAVGIGGAYMCIYGMEGPGGYQLVGRTVQVWNSFRQTDVFEPGKPWLLRFFDQIRYYEVSEAELEEMRAGFPYGQFSPKIEHTTFSLSAYRAFLAQNAQSIQAAKARQQAAFEAERARWVAAGYRAEESPAEPVLAPEAATALAADEQQVSSPVSGSLWRLAVAPGAVVRQGEVLLVLEAMKTEIAVTAPMDGEVREICVAEGKPVRAGQRLAVLKAAHAA